MTKLSYIVPVYNVAPYLRKCVDSLLAQDYENYEIILVDDGSTDGSGAICDEYARVTSEAGKELENERVRELGKVRIRVIHQKNAGLSAARNTGIAAAKGEYICFVDSDDYWQPNVLGGLMAQVEREQLDVLRFDYQNVRFRNERVRELESEGEYEVFEPNKYPHPVDTCHKVVDGMTYLNERMGYACYAVMYIVKRAILEENRKRKGKCFFSEGIHFEDVDWLPRMMLQAKRVNSTPTIVYNYLVRQGSITKTQGDKGRMRKNVEDQMLVIEKYTKLMAEYPQCTWLRRMQSNMAVGVLTSVAREFYKEREDYIKRLCELRVFPLAIADQGRTYTRRARIINAYGSLIYCALVNLRKKLK